MADRFKFAKVRQEIIDAALKTVDMYSIERFYNNIMEVYNRAIKKYW